MKWFGVLFIGGLLADDMIIFSPLNLETGGVTRDVIDVKPTRKTEASREKTTAARRLFIPSEIVSKQGSCGEWIQIYIVNESTSIRNCLT